MSVAAVGGAVVAGGLAYAGSQKAAGAQAAGASAANGLTQDQFNSTRAANRPIQQTGLAANNYLAGLLGIADDIPDRTYQELMAELTPNYFSYGRITGKKYIEPARAKPEARRILKEQEERKRLIEQMKADGTYGSLLKQFGQSDLDNDVIYQSGFQNAIDEGTKGVNRLAASMGGFKSGATLMALQKKAAQTANQYGTDAFNRWNTGKLNTYNMLSGQSGAGQAAINNVSSAGANAAQSMGQNLIGMGNARAASAIGQANAIGGAISNGFNMYQQNKLYNALTG